MKYVKYHYKTKVTFSNVIRSHFFLLRCTTQDNDFQQVITEECNVYPQISLHTDKDNFGNIVRSGYIEEMHDFFEFETLGEVKLSEPYLLKEELNRIFLYPSLYTYPDDSIIRLRKAILLNNNTSITDTVLKLSDVLYRILEYSPNTTTIHTTASEALKLGRGVCQDFAHLMIALCRSAGIAARYVTGFMEGEGYTHAWVEYYENGYWKAIDPTHNHLIEMGYVKISHGRDFDDCSIERGIFTGIVDQKLEVQLSVGMNDCQ
ncbi:MAG: transglutaminase family protein [Candidatus Symbiothrix sp.]|jgi:transglutaminase-like putative cysteine protease|nr:transglutaminase family protein [Candidatus Symbiothrix sp.]